MIVLWILLIVVMMGKWSDDSACCPRCPVVQCARHRGDIW